MLKKLIVAFLLIAAFALGFGLASVRWFFQTKTLAAHFYNVGLMEMANDVIQLQAGNADEVLKRKKGALPILTQSFDSVYRRQLPESESLATLWAISRCYETPGTEIPESIKSILSGLPPRPKTSCELKAGQHEKLSNK